MKTAARPRWNKFNKTPVGLFLLAKFIFFNLYHFLDKLDIK